MVRFPAETQFVKIFLGVRASNIKNEEEKDLERCEKTHFSVWADDVSLREISIVQPKTSSTDTK